MLTVREPIFVTTYPLDLETLGGGSWVDRRLIGQLRDVGLEPRVFPVATLHDGPNSVPLEVRTRPLIMARTALRMVGMGEPYAVAKFVGSRAWKVRADELKGAAEGRTVIASQFPSLLLCRSAQVSPAFYVAHNVDSVIAKNHNPRPLEWWRDSHRLADIENDLLASLPAIGALSHVDARRLRRINPRTIHLPLLSGRRGERIKPPRAVGFIGKLSWPPNRIALNVLLQDVLPGLRNEMGSATPEFVIAGRGTADLGHEDGVSFLGEVTDLRSFYNRIAVVAIPRLGLSTGVSVKMLEALEHGIPVIAPMALAEAAGMAGNVITADTAGEMVSALAEFFGAFDRGATLEPVAPAVGAVAPWHEFFPVS